MVRRHALAMATLLLLLTALPATCQPPGAKNGQADPVPVVVSVAVVEVVGEAPTWLAPATPAGDRKTTLRKVWGTPTHLLAAIRKEAPNAQVRLRFYGAVMALPEQEAHIESGQQVQMGDDTRLVGNALGAVVQLGEPDKIGLTLKLEVSEVTGEVPHAEVEGAVIPIVSSQEMQTSLVLSDDEEVVVGGGTANQTRTDDNGGPLVHTIVLAHAKIVR